MHRKRSPETQPSRRRSWTVLIAWGVAVVVLAAFGTGVEQRLSPMSLEVPGTPSSRAEALLRAKFGNTVPIAILLRGPSSQIEAEGPRLAAALRREHDVEVLSPWDQATPAPASPAPADERPARVSTASTASASAREAADTEGEGAQSAASAEAQSAGSAQAPSTRLHALRPGPDSAFVLVNYVRPPSDAMAVVPRTEALLKATVHAPVHSYLTGVAVIGRAIQQQTLKDTEQAETIALPVLILVLLLVFRSPIAAAVPLAMGGATVVAGHGLLWIASWVTPINSLGVAIAAMMSLALGVDYALLMVSRVRQELAAGSDHATAVTSAARSAGRTIAAAGGTLALTMLAASVVATPGLLGPVAIGVVISGLLSVALALTAMPALLLLIGPSLNRWEIRLRRRRSGARHGRIRAFADRLIARPAITAPVILLGMLALATPAIALRMGPPDASELPSSSPARQAVQMVEKTIGAGWAAPFVVVASAREGAITTQPRLRALMHWQEQVASQPDVAAVLGPASVAGARAKLAEAHTALQSAPKHLEGARRGIAGLRSGLQRASKGVGRLRKGLAAAAAGARSLGGGAGQARDGAQKLATESGRAHAGAQRLATETGKAHEGARTLSKASGRAHSGAQELATESGRAHRGAQKLARETGRADEGAGRLQEGLDEAAAGSKRLASGLDEAAAGAERLANGNSELTAGAEQLAAGMDALDGTVHTALAPIETIAGQLHEWAVWLESLQVSGEQLEERLSQATQAMHAIPVSHEDPRYQTLNADIEAIAEEVRRNGLSQLSHVRQLLCDGVKALAELPAELERLTESLDRLTAGADRLANGARESEEGAKALDVALHRLAAGGHTLSDGLTSLSGGAGELAHGLGRLHQGNRRLANGLGRLHQGNRRLANGLGRLHQGNRKLAGGLGQLQNGNEQLAGGLGQLQNGDERLAGGLGQLQSGDEQLAGGLTGAGAKTGKLAGGLGKAQHPLHTYATMLAAYQRDYQLLNTDSPKALDSGYLVLTALDGTVSPLREQVAQMVNVDGGGQAVRMMIVADSPPSSAATVALSRRLRHELPSLAKATGTTVQIGQGAQYLLDYKNANTARFPWLVFALAIVATLTLIVVLRALLLPLIAVVLNLATIFVALGALVLLTQEHIVGGPGYIDAASGAGIISIMFVLSIDYEVFLLTRMRERWAESHDANEAIAHGLKHTAGVITGSAAIMTAVFLAFASASVVPLRQFGVGLTIAVLLDATIVRLVLLPAIMRLAGPRIWWMPDWLARRLPNVE